jgi:hypothetical protein
MSSRQASKASALLLGHEWRDIAYDLRVLSSRLADPSGLWICARVDDRSWPRAERQFWAIEPEYRTLAARRPFNAGATMALFRH